MNVGNTVFSQLISLVPDFELRKCIDRCRGNFHARRFTCCMSMYCPRVMFLFLSLSYFVCKVNKLFLQETIFVNLWLNLFCQFFLFLAEVSNEGCVCWVITFCVHLLLTTFGSFGTLEIEADVIE